MGTTTITPAKPASSPEKEGRDSTGRGGFGGGGPGGGGGWGRGSPEVSARVYRTGMWMAMVAIVMLFAAFTSALVIRKGFSSDWIHIALPHILWLNTAILLASSLTLEVSRRSLRAGRSELFGLWWQVTTGLGVAFIAGQLLAWRELAARGVYLATNPSSSFFYLFTAAHGVHLLGGITALFYVVVRARRIVPAIAAPAAVDVTAIYWHFMDALWIYIFVLLLVRF